MRLTLIACVAAATLAACSEPAPQAGVDIPELDNDDWHAINAKADGVVTADSGLQYKVIQPGIEGGAKAEPGQPIAAHYHGTFRDGEVFDSSYERGQPLTGPSNGFIKGWNEALGEMSVCEARTLYIPSDLAYGDNGRGGIPGKATLLFNMQLLAVAGEAEDGEVTQCPADKVLSGPEAYAETP